VPQTQSHDQLVTGRHPTVAHAVGDELGHQQLCVREHRRRNSYRECTGDGARAIRGARAGSDL
jgi:hypothetical protein